MAAGGGRRRRELDADLYAVLGLSRECTDAELRLAYRRLAMVWHPDRCSPSATTARVQEAKERFQEIQGAYSVLSDSNKRLLYDIGVYDSEDDDDDDDDLSGMGDFLGEMAQMMSQATPTESFEELQQLFVHMFQADLDAGPAAGHRAQAHSPPWTSQSPSWPPPSPPIPSGTRAHTPMSCKGANKRCSSAMGSAQPPRTCCPGQGPYGFSSKGSDWTPEGSSGGERRSGRKQRLSTSRDVSSDDDDILASRARGSTQHCDSETAFPGF